MAKGVTTDRATIYKIMNSYFETRSYTQTGRDLEIPTSTVEKLVKEHLHEKEYVELWNKKKEDFCTKADIIIHKAMDRLVKELDSEKEIPVNQLTTAIGTMYDKKALNQTGNVSVTPAVQINIVDNNQLEKVLYEENWFRTFKWKKRL